MMRLDAVAGEIQSGHLLPVAPRHSGLDLSLANSDAGGTQVEPVEAARQLDERRIAVAAYLGNDGTRGLIDVLGYLALGG